jgi:imidazoleglycerol-phosphate dehydratase/histidinol-phosphatase
MCSLQKILVAKAIWLNNHPGLGGTEVKDNMKELEKVVALETHAWEEIYTFLKLGLRFVIQDRNTNETKIQMNVDGSGKADISTGIGFLILAGTDCRASKDESCCSRER